MNVEELDEANLNYWLAWVLGEPLDTLRVEGQQCIRSDGAIVDYLNDPSILSLLVEEGLFGKHKNDRVTFNGNRSRDKKFTAEIDRAEGRPCRASGPNVTTAVFRAVILFAYQYGRSS